MLAVLGWVVVTAILALWSLAAWAMHGVAVWTLSNAGALSGSAAGVAGLQLPDWLSPWVPQELVQSITAMLAGLGPVIDGLLQGAPALAGGLTVVAWVVWGLGAVLLVALGAAVHALAAMWQRRGAGPMSGARSTVAAG
jgi:hypothetical protein